MEKWMDIRMVPAGEVQKSVYERRKYGWRCTKKAKSMVKWMAPAGEVERWKYRRWKY